MTLLGQTIAMIVFVWFCMKYIWPPILAALEERQQQIEEGLAAADKSQEKLVTAQAEADVIVAEARQQATGIMDQAHARANEIVADGKSAGVKERERQLAAAHAEIEQESHRARDYLKSLYHKKLFWRQLYHSLTTHLPSIVYYSRMLQSILPKKPRNFVLCIATRT